MHSPGNFLASKRSRRVVMGVLCALGLSLLAPGPAMQARAQGTAQVQIMGVPPQLSSLRVEALVRNYESGQYPVQFIYNDPAGREAAFRFVLEVAYEGSIVLEMTSQPTTFAPGVYVYSTFRDAPRVQFPGGMQSLFGGFDPGFQQRIRESGGLPEGNYTVTLEARPVDPSRLIASLPGQVSLRADLAEPPVLIYPNDGAIVTEATPQFSWAPATSLPGGTMVDYVLRIVELRPGQTRLQALRGNIPHVETVQTGITTFTYLPNEVPLDNGQRYVWQIVARDANGVVPFSSDGETELYTFTYADPSAQRYVWRYPSAENPLIEIPISEYARTDGGGLTVNGVYPGTVAGETVQARFGDDEQAVEFAVEGFGANARLELTWGTIRLSNGMTFTPDD